VHAWRATWRRLLFVACLLAAAPGAIADPAAPGLFDAEDTLTVAITAPWRELIRNRNFQGAYPATIEYVDRSGAPVSLALTVERRGINRQKVCRFPPIKLRFDNETVAGTVFQGQKSLKMVTHCQERSNYDQLYVLEMLAYRIYNQLTDRSFRVRPLTVTYRDTDGGKEDDPVFAFLIEDDKEVAHRLGLKKITVPSIGPQRLDPGDAALMSLFQYLIANADWAALRGPDPDECCHNVKLLGPKPEDAPGPLIAVPYDFDASGLVNADYAAPAPGLPIRKVTQHLFWGYCAHNDALPGARRQVLAQEQAIYDLVSAEENLQSRRRDRANKFLEKGFKVLRDDKDFQRQVVGKCRG